MVAFVFIRITLWFIFLSPKRDNKFCCLSFFATLVGVNKYWNYNHNSLASFFISYCYCVKIFHIITSFHYWLYIFQYSDESRLNNQNLASHSPRQKYFYRLCRSLMSDFVFMLQITTDGGFIILRKAECSILLFYIITRRQNSHSGDKFSEALKTREFSSFNQHNNWLTHFGRKISFDSGEY